MFGYAFQPKEIGAQVRLDQMFLLCGNNLLERGTDQRFQLRPGMPAGISPVKSYCEAFQPASADI